MSPVSIRYIVNDVDAAVDFYTRYLDFEVKMRPGPGFASLMRGDLNLLLNAPGAGGAGQAMADGEAPGPGGWNRFQLTIDNLEQLYDDLIGKGVHFRNKVIVGQGGKQVLLEDPSGNLIELFEPKAAD